MYSVEVTLSDRLLDCPTDYVDCGVHCLYMHAAPDSYYALLVSATVMFDI